MQEFEYTIRDKLGIHARPAGLLVKEASKYDADITLSVGGKTADCKKIFSLMGAGIKFGNAVTVCVEGADEEAACAGVEAFFEQNL